MAMINKSINKINDNNPKIFKKSVNVQINNFEN